MSCQFLMYFILEYTSSLSKGYKWYKSKLFVTIVKWPIFSLPTLSACSFCLVTLANNTRHCHFQVRIYSRYCIIKHIRYIFRQVSSVAKSDIYFNRSAFSAVNPLSFHMEQLSCRRSHFGKILCWRTLLKSVEKNKSVWKHKKVSDTLHENLNMFMIFLWINSAYSLFRTLIRYMKYFYNKKMHFNFMILWWRIITGEGHISDKIQGYS